MVRKGNDRKKVSQFRSVKKRNHFRSRYWKIWACNRYGERVKLVRVKLVRLGSMKCIDASDVRRKTG